MDKFKGKGKSIGKEAFFIKAEISSEFINYIENEYNVKVILKDGMFYVESLDDGSSSYTSFRNILKGDIYYMRSRQNNTNFDCFIDYKHIEEFYNI